MRLCLRRPYCDLAQEGADGARGPRSPEGEATLLPALVANGPREDEVETKVWLRAKGALGDFGLVRDRVSLAVEHEDSCDDGVNYPIRRGRSRPPAAIKRGGGTLNVYGSIIEGGRQISPF